MQKTSDNQKLASTTHRAVQKSTTLNRRYVKRPAPMVKKIAIDDDKSEEAVILSANLEDAIQEAKDIETIEAKSEKKVQVEKRIQIEGEEKHPAISKFSIPVEEKVEEKVEKKIAVEDEMLPPEPNPYQDAINARSGALEVKKAAGKSAEFYVGPTASERKNAEIEKALKEVAKSSVTVMPKKELSPKKAAAIARQAEKAAKKSTAKSEKMALRAQAKKLSEERRAEKRARQEKFARQAKLAKETEKDSVLTRNVKKNTTDMSLKHASSRHGGRGKRMVLALSCSVACVVALGALVYKNIPDISVKVTAMQSGIDASYPSYIPRDFQLGGVSVDDEGAVVMEFKGPNDAKFTVSEKESSWDSSALLNNYVKKNWSDAGYIAARENGITIYICDSSAVWVNGGILYRISASSGTLTKKQIKNIVTSI